MSLVKRAATLTSRVSHARAQALSRGCVSGRRLHDTSRKGDSPTRREKHGMAAGQQSWSTLVGAKLEKIKADEPALPSFATCNPDMLSPQKPGKVKNIVAGKWVEGTGGAISEVLDPLTGQVFIECAEVLEEGLDPYVASLQSCPKYGLHNPFLNVKRYLDYGQISAKAAQMMADPAVEHFFARLIQRVSPKSYAQAKGEVVVTRKFLENFSGDQVRFLVKSFGVPGDHAGQMSNGYRWPYGGVAIVTPFNFPLEIPVLQLMGALYMGNRPVLKVDHKVAIVMEQYMRMMHACGMPIEDVDMINCEGAVMHQLLLRSRPRTTLFTGSSRVANLLAVDLQGKVKLEGAGYDWKVLGPDVPTDQQAIDYVAHVCDQDAYACSGQKCSAQSMLLMHKNWHQTDLLASMTKLAQQRTLKDLTVGPILSVTTEQVLDHVEALLKVPGAKLLFGGKELNGGEHTIPACFGAVEPTAVFVPIAEIIRSPKVFALVTTEIFGPFQIVTEFGDEELPLVLEGLERLEEHLTAAIVSNDPRFQQTLLAHSVNGTTYCGLRARTTGAPQNHWFGPAGDPRAAGIGTKEAIQLTWSCHREIIHDVGPVPAEWKTPPPS
eukprot:CAMPEP_0181336676 /NCGR_PEP_ID=MMETSP1101-20121128/27558_1 /TAXON_ID=46948 /ORGANISM="Rhodomonas abbreviata, Strain Caron Lab Isolate" /LENGTH=605 /DNA_ID=CAMNT_0023447011 /DNA_START=105 /DNA_END=1922 /DNA_ORIENTATION=+